MKRPVSSRIAMHRSVNVSSNSSTSASDSWEGGKSFSRPSSSSYLKVFTSTFASGQSFLASKASSVSFSSNMPRSVLMLAWFCTTDDLLDSLHELCRPAYLPMGYLITDSCLVVISSLPHDKSRGQVVPEESGVELLLADEFVL